MLSIDDAKSQQGAEVYKKNQANEENYKRGVFCLQNVNWDDLLMKRLKPPFVPTVVSDQSRTSDQS